MVGEKSSYRWMLLLLDHLFDAYDHATALRMLRDPDERLVVAGNARTLGILSSKTELDSGEWDNLLVALLALRLKFTQPEAREKVELNIAMREGRS
jgi:hypothetical protein